MVDWLVGLYSEKLKTENTKSKLVYSKEEREKKNSGARSRGSIHKAREKCHGEECNKPAPAKAGEAIPIE
jgi:hypothetical protein